MIQLWRTRPRCGKLISAPGAQYPQPFSPEGIDDPFGNGQSAASKITLRWKSPPSAPSPRLLFPGLKRPNLFHVKPIPSCAGHGSTWNTRAISESLYPEDKISKSARPQETPTLHESEKATATQKLPKVAAGIKPNSLVRQAALRLFRVLRTASTSASHELRREMVEIVR
jgi:hypothetical protein